MHIFGSIYVCYHTYLYTCHEKVLTDVLNFDESSLVYLLGYTISRGGSTCKTYTLSVVVPMGWVGDLLKKDLVPMGTKSLFWQILGVKYPHKRNFFKIKSSNYFVIVLF